MNRRVTLEAIAAPSELRTAPAADYAALGLVLPELITELHAVAVSDPAR